jgi:MoaA/NifB/PqqE/SkfB family radical SAM enzyme
MLRGERQCGSNIDYIALTVGSFSRATGRRDNRRKLTGSPMISLTKPIFFSRASVVGRAPAGAAAVPEAPAVFKSSQSIAEFRDTCQAFSLHTPQRFLHLELDIVNRCNIQCVMCYHSLEATRVPIVYLDVDVFASAAASILPHASHLSLSLGNEPLMSPHFEAMLKIVSAYQVPHVNFFTNGLLITDKKIAAMVDYGVTQICISVDGATAATYNGIRRGGDFDDLVRNVERLVHLRDSAHSRTPRVRFDVVMMRRNIRELPDIVRLAARLGVEQMSFRHMVSFEGLDMEHESLFHAKTLSNYWLGSALEAAAQWGLEVQTRPALFDAEASPDAPAQALATKLPTPYCPFPFFHLSMGPGGHVLPCPHSHGEAPYGQVTATTPMDTIWLNDQFNTLRNRILRFDPPDMCQRCPFLASVYPNSEALFATRKH